MKVSAQTAAATDFDFEDDLMDDEMSLVSACSHVRECVRTHTHTHTQSTSAILKPYTPNPQPGGSETQGRGDRLHRPAQALIPRGSDEVRHPGKTNA